jgi:hypothetical protein
MKKNLPIVFLFVVAAGCGGAAATANQQAWNKAVSSDTCDAYVAFLKDFPESAEAADARSRQRAACEKDDWDKVKASSSYASYKAYVERNKDGEHAAEARKVLALRAVKRVGLEISSHGCSEDACSFIAIARKVLKNAGIEVAERSEAADVVMKIDSAISLLNASRTEPLPYSSIEGSISLQSGGSTIMSRQFNGRATGGWEVYDVHQTPRWASTPTVFNAAPVEESMTALVKDFFGR